MTRIAVTGANGKAGRAVVADLLDAGHEVLATDLAGPFAWHNDLAPVVQADLTEYGAAVEALTGCSAVVHMANIPAPGLATPARTFTVNTAMNSNIFLAAAALGLERVVWASSETTLGLSYEDTPPRYLPVDEDHYPLPTSTYALSKVVGETMAEHISAWSGIPFIGLRLSNVFTEQDYADQPSFTAQSRLWNAWGYVDVRDVALACRLALTAEITGARSYVIAAADTILDRPSAELTAEVFPGVEVRRPLEEFETLLSIDRARAELGYEPQHSWRGARSS
ncbi:nucleoside-diphosphate-sugar epimerase [Motilibacter rhizosphaerae]|uniref:Nucleoside-diphosphate-sugar epimerase n=1 Tax=Motilibacter rhizosphaerae TaxID=598652 RepID=A0A4Q7NQT2_9ACTN|nr:NAD(P)-dependent oxidoreductase [Motilibacter rhizosphaerae]RZS87512.1 nucleoside-diphosphate-sugar epimerase [Motilibacter rhizosphaerae]